MTDQTPKEHFGKMTLAQLVYGLTETGWLAGKHSTQDWWEGGARGWGEEGLAYVKYITEELERRIKEQRDETI